VILRMYDKLLKLYDYYAGFMSDSSLKALNFEQAGDVNEEPSRLDISMLPLDNP